LHGFSLLLDLWISWFYFIHVTFVEPLYHAEILYLWKNISRWLAVFNGYNNKYYKVRLCCICPSSKWYIFNFEMHNWIV
jgi:hypothetical protein